MSAADPSHTGGLAPLPEPPTETVTYAVPTTRDGADMWRLARDSRTLDLNSPYMYLLGATHFAKTSVVARTGTGSAARTVGFVWGYRRPEAADTLFVWQVAVAPDMRGRRIAAGMLTALTDRLRGEGCRFLEASVTPDNQPSAALFTGFARDAGVPMQNQNVMFSADDFPTEQSPDSGPASAGSHDPAHQPEVLYRIGPFPS